MNKVWLFLCWIVKNHIQCFEWFWTAHQNELVVFNGFLISLNTNYLFHHFSHILQMKKLSKLSKSRSMFISRVVWALVFSLLFIYSCNLTMQADRGYTHFKIFSDVLEPASMYVCVVARECSCLKHCPHSAVGIYNTQCAQLKHSSAR